MFHNAARLFAGLLLITGFLFADGGTVQLRKQVGSLMITVFSTPVPLRVGIADLSTMIQKAGDQTAVLDGTVMLHLAKSGEREILVAATPAQATNKLLYGARVTLPSSGDWRLHVYVTVRGEAAEVSGQIDVLPEQPPLVAYWEYFMVVPVGVTLFAMNQHLKSRRLVRNSRALL